MQPLHFSHANSFPASCYRKYLSHFAGRYQVGFIDTLGHDPRYPVSDCWPHLIDETLHHIENHYAQPVIAVGHSLGGFLSFMAAIKRPELFRAVILLDSPIFSRTVSSSLWLGKRLGFIEKMTPGRGMTEKRRQYWPNVDAVQRHFSGKGQFAQFDPDCLRDYAEHGTSQDGEGVRLKFRPQIEHQIYMSLPHHFPSLRGQLKVPTGFIGGEQSRYVRGADLKHMRDHFGIHISQLAGGHLFPLECPQRAASATETMIQTLLAV